jgi:hypothetical protein
MAKTLFNKGVVMTWVLYVLLMTNERSLQGILSEHYFKTEQECNQFYTDNKADLDRSVEDIVQPRITKYEIIHIGCLPNHKIKGEK